MTAVLTDELVEWAARQYRYYGARKLTADSGDTCWIEMDFDAFLTVLRMGRHVFLGTSMNETEWSMWSLIQPWHDLMFEPPW